MIQFQEIAWTEERAEGRKDGRTDKPYFIGPFRLPSGFQYQHETTHKYQANIKKKY